MSEEAKNETPFYDPDPITMPVLALRGLVVYPKMMVHFDVGREASVKAVEEAMSTNSPVFLVAQKDIRVEEPEKKDLFSAGTIAQVRQILRLPGKTVRVCVASGLHNVKRVLDGIRDGSLQYDFVEFMACPGGCINGGGQPFIHEDRKGTLERRMEGLYAEDAGKPCRLSHENPDIKKLYEAFLGEPGSEKAHRLLHTVYHHNARS